MSGNLAKNEKEPLLTSSKTISHDHGRDKQWGPPARYVFAVLCFLGLINVYALRVNLSVALVAMVNTTATNQNEANVMNECPVPAAANQSTKTGEFNWDADLQGLVLGSFFYGYIATQLPGGWLAQRWGGKYFFGLGILWTGLLTILTPIAARTSVYFLIALRVLEGVGEGVTYPALNVCMSKWLPPLERTKIGLFIHSGGHLGAVLAFPISGVLAVSDIAGGWPSIFYIFGGVACIWSLSWFILVHESPAKHPRITKQERLYIEESIGHTNKRDQPFPVGSVFKSTAVWALMSAHFANNWSYYTLLTVLPTYMADVLKFNVSQNGLLSALPYIAVVVFANVSGQIADWVREKNIGTTLVRKICNTSGLVLSAVFQIAVGFVGCNQVAAVSILIAAGCGIGIATAGYNINHLDIAPIFAGNLFAITNTIATIPGMVGPTVAGAFTENNSTSGQWQKVFLLAAGIDLAGAMIYLIFGSGEEQSWATETYTSVENITRDTLNKRENVCVDRKIDAS